MCVNGFHIAIGVTCSGRWASGGADVVYCRIAVGILHEIKSWDICVTEFILKLTSKPLHCMHWKSMRPWLLHSSPMHFWHWMSRASHLDCAARESSSWQPLSLTITVKQRLRGFPVLQPILLTALEDSHTSVQQIGAFHSHILERGSLTINTLAAITGTGSWGIDSCLSRLGGKC